MTEQRKKRLAIYLPSLASGGAERMKINLAAEFMRNGYEVIFVLSQAEGSLIDALPAGARIVPLGHARTLACLMPLVFFLRRERPDILFSNLGHNNIIAIWAKYLSGTRVKVMVSQHSALSAEAAAGNQWKYRLLPFFYRWFLRFADQVVAVSNGVADDMARTISYARERISVIYNPITTRDFAERVEEPIHHPWFAVSEPPVILAVGRLAAQKNFVLLLHAFAQAAKTRDMRLVILGEGPQKAELQALAGTLGIAGRFQLPGFVANPLPYMRRAKVMVLSSLYEGFGNVLAEALACGTPVVSTDCPHGPSEVLEQGKYGRLVPVGDSSAMAAALVEMLDNPPPRAYLATRGHAFTVEAAAGYYMALFEAVLSRKGFSSAAA